MYKAEIKRIEPRGWGLAPCWWRVTFFWRDRSYGPWDYLEEHVYDSWGAAMKDANETIRRFYDSER